MKIRFIPRVHYQVSRPGIFSIILLNCSSKNQGTYPENIAQKLNRLKEPHFENNETEFDQFIVNEESAKFAVSMAQALEFLTSNCNWDWRGYSIAEIIKEQDKTNLDSYLILSEIEKVLFMKYFLEADGAALLEFSKVVDELKIIPRSMLLKEYREQMNQVFINIWGSYKNLSSDLKDKMNMSENIRNLKRKKDKDGWGYTYKNLIHKVQARIFPLVDMGIINRIKQENNEVIFSTNSINGKSYTSNLIEELISIEVMESRFNKHEFFRIIANTFVINYREYDNVKDFKIVSELIINTYHSVKEPLTKLSSISVISDVVSSKLLVNSNILIERPQIEDIIIELKQMKSHKIYIHVDKYGNKAFVVIN